ncbi:MAG: carboxypeptidase-like regulatory domain-containing protein, partial [Pirellulales bacterium]|nr:carboxypeptidase-like regulatory domain-containing protein [Pirellulales bacterium]
MRSRIKGIAAVFLLTLTTVVSQAATLSGTVTDVETLDPIEDVMVMLWGNVNDSLTAFSNTEGVYTFNDVEPGIHALMGLHGDYEFYMDPYPLEIVEGENFHDFAMTPITPPEPATLAGTVYADDNPVEGAVLTVMQEGGEFQSVESETDGSYLFEELFEGWTMFTVEYEGYQTYYTNFIMSPGENLRDIELHEIYSVVVTIQGRVIDLITREPLPDAQLELSEPMYPDNVWNTVSDENGEYLFSDIETSTWLLQMWTQLDGYEDDISFVPFHGNDPDSIWFDIFLLPSDIGDLSGINGQVTFDETGVPVIMAMMEAISTDPEDEFSYFAPTNPAGLYEIILPHGEYCVSCSYMMEFDTTNGSWQYTEYYDDVLSIDEATPLTVDPGEIVTGIDFGIPLDDGGTFTVELSGLVRDTDGVPLANALVRFWTEEEEIGDGVITDDSGQWDAELIRDRLPIVPFAISAQHDSFQMEFFSNAPSFNTA